MKVILRTEIEGFYKEVIQRFDLDLFQFLQPKVPKTEILKFTGSSKGDIVHIRFLSPLNTDWISEITADEVNDKQAYFIDKGKVLPWPLKKWEHKHIVNNLGKEKSEIVDEMHYSTSNKILDFLIWPALFLGFFPRKRQYKRYFNS